MMISHAFKSVTSTFSAQINSVNYCVAKFATQKIKFSNTEGIPYKTFSYFLFYKKFFHCIYFVNVLYFMIFRSFCTCRHCLLIFVFLSSPPLYSPLYLSSSITTQFPFDLFMFETFSSQFYVAQFPFCFLHLSHPTTYLSSSLDFPSRIFLYICSLPILYSYPFHTFVSFRFHYSLFSSIPLYLFVLHLYHSNLFSLQFPFSNFPFSVEFINFRFFLFLISSAPSASIPSTLFPVSLPPSSH